MFEDRITIDMEKYSDLIKMEIKYHLYEEVINKAIQYCLESSLTIKSDYFLNVLRILKGEDIEE